MKQVRFDVLMEPMGKGRPRSTKVGVTFTDPKTVNAEQAIRHAWREAGAEKIDGHVQVDVVAVYPRPKSHFRANGQLKPTAPQYVGKRPDVDNILKLIGDALNGYLWSDDSQIVKATVTKVFVRDNIPPQISIAAWSMT